MCRGLQSLEKGGEGRDQATQWQAGNTESGVHQRVQGVFGEPEVLIEGTDNEHGTGSLTTSKLRPTGEPEYALKAASE